MLSSFAKCYGQLLENISYHENAAGFYQALHTNCSGLVGQPFRDYYRKRCEYHAQQLIVARREELRFRDMAEKEPEREVFGTSTDIFD